MPPIHPSMLDGMTELNPSVIPDRTDSSKPIQGDIGNLMSKQAYDNEMMALDMGISARAIEQLNATEGTGLPQHPDFIRRVKELVAAGEFDVPDAPSQWTQVWDLKTWVTHPLFRQNLKSAPGWKFYGEHS